MCTKLVGGNIVINSLAFCLHPIIPAYLWRCKGWVALRNLVLLVTNYVVLVYTSIRVIHMHYSLVIITAVCSTMSCNVIRVHCLQYPDSIEVELRPDMMESCHKMLSVSLSTLAQLATSFCQIYEAEIQPWCTRQASPPTTLGPLCRRVDHLKTQIDQV